MPIEPQHGGRGFDRNYKRGAIMGLTVAEAFILLCFCLLLLFTWWQTDTEKRSLMAAEKIATLSDTEKAAIIAGLADGTFVAAAQLRAAGFVMPDISLLQDTAKLSRFMPESEAKRLMKGVVELSPETRLDLAKAVDVTDELALQAALQKLINHDDDTTETIARRIENAANDQRRMVDMLDDTIGDKIRVAGGSIDATGTITLPESILFERGESKVKNPAFVKELCTAWLEALHASHLNISDLKVEGHASSEGKTGHTPEQAYLHNLNLSQERAQNALKICLSGAPPGDLQWARQHLAAVGYSSARLILNDDGTENRERSRRVMFSVSLNRDGLIDSIKRDLGAREELKSALMNATGPARVIDGDTLEVLGSKFRLAGIDAPERGQTCTPKIGFPFDCGEAARKELEDVIAGREVTCSGKDLDRYGRTVATCEVGNADLAELMVMRGYALPFEPFSDAYKTRGDEAQALGVGIWQSQFEKPWDYRKAH